MTRNTMKHAVKLATAWSVAMLLVAATLAQDVPGVEICTREARLDRRTSCLQGNVEFLQQVVTKNALDAQQKLSAANREIATLKEQLAASNRDLAALKDALSAMEAKIGEIHKAAPQPAPDVKPQGKR
jgi:septal ring factor EnvC (AmiA/AmiB activator)